MKLISWNVNGIRAIQKKGFLDWLAASDADIIALQETKAHPDQLDEALLKPDNYHVNWASAQKKGYSGVAVYSKKKPLSCHQMGQEAFDAEGRVLVSDFEDFTLINAYFPNSQEKGKRIDYKLAFCSAMLELCENLRKAGKNLVLCGDLNIAHKPIDLKNPDTNHDSPGFLPQERAWMDVFIEENGYVDTFRSVYPDKESYTWWSYRTRARERDIGWRIDYHVVNPEFAPAIKEVRIYSDVMGSDHCPVGLSLSL